MCRAGRSPLLAAAALAVLLGLSGQIALGENIDPGGGGEQYAWAENVGWLNAEPLGNGGPGVQVDDFELTGWLWGENIGWVSLSCENTSSCATTSYGVANNGFGVLSGFAWGENVGWINFDPFSSDVTINPATGEFGGKAWGENIGWITFASASPVAYRVRSGWCQATAAPPGSTFTLKGGKSGTALLLSWTALATASWYDVVRGELGTLRTSGGNFAVSTQECVAEKITATGHTFSGPAPGLGNGFWFLVRGANCKGHGTYNSGDPRQVGLRDAEIAASGNDCP